MNTTTNVTYVLYDESSDSYIVLDYTPAPSAHYVTGMVSDLRDATHWRSRRDAKNAMTSAKLDPRYVSVVRVTTTIETE